MRALESSVQKEILIRLLSEIDKFCREQNIMYYVAYGTLLGTVRHGGFIPWDDDIDIWMLRQDYDRFISTFNRDKRKETFIVDGKSSSKYPYTYAKVSDRDTCVTEYLYKPYEIGVYVDIFPIDCWPKDDLTLNEILSTHRKLKSKTYRISKRRSLIKNIELIAARVFYFNVSKQELINKITALAVTDSFVESTYCGNTVANVYKQKEKLCTEWFNGVLEMQFEEIKVWVPRGYREILTMLYGNYMELPPKEQQIPHHSSDAWMR